MCARTPVLDIPEDLVFTMATLTVFNPPLRSLFYHGTSAEAARSIQINGFKASKNDGDWLGDGVYFFDVRSRAEQWAKYYHRDASPTLITVEVDLSNCMDLSDQKWAQVLHRHADRLLTEAKHSGHPEIIQNEVFHGKDSFVINSIADRLANHGLKVSCVKGLFTSGDLAYPGSALALEAHAQLAVRNTEIISIRAIEQLSE
jgi:gll3454 protein